MVLSSKIIKTPEVAKDECISAAIKDFLSEMNSGGGPGLETLPPEEARRESTNMQESVKVDYSGISEFEHTIEAEGFTIKLNIVRPIDNEEKLPFFVFAHGGGWVLGDYPTSRRMVRDIVVMSGMGAVFVNYTLSPEAQFPQAINEIYAASKWLSKNAENLNFDADRMAIIGNSAGGNMATVAAIKALEDGSSMFKVQILLWPVADARFDYDSYERFGKDRFLSAAVMKWMFNNYTMDMEARKDIYISPTNASSKQLKGLPPTFLHIAEADILRDGAEMYARKLDEAGVPVTSLVYQGMIHDFGLLNPLAELPQTRTLFMNIAAQLKASL